jgi:hypothetical protein
VPEAVPVRRRGLQGADVELDGVVAAGVGARHAGGDDVGEVLVGGDLPVDLGRGSAARPRTGVGRRRHPRPEHHAVGDRVARRGTVLEVTVAAGGGR